MASNFHEKKAHSVETEDRFRKSMSSNINHRAQNVTSRSGKMWAVKEEGFCSEEHETRLASSLWAEGAGGIRRNQSCLIHHTQKRETKRRIHAEQSLYRSQQTNKAFFLPDINSAGGRLELNTFRRK